MSEYYRHRYLDVDIARRELEHEYKYNSILDEILEREEDCNRCTSDNRPSRLESILDSLS